MLSMRSAIRPTAARGSTSGGAARAASAEKRITANRADRVIPSRPRGREMERFRAPLHAGGRRSIEASMSSDRPGNNAGRHAGEDDAVTPPSGSQPGSAALDAAETLAAAGVLAAGSGAAERPGASIGRYTLIEEIGS